MLESNPHGSVRGWNLADAIERTADPDLWVKWQTAKADWEALKARPKDGWQPSVSSIAETRQRATDAWDEVRVQFLDHLLRERLIAFGSPNGPSEARRPIYSQGWANMTLRNLERSIVQERSGARTKLYNVGVFPLVHSPDVTERLSGVSLAGAFIKCVIEDPEVAGRGKLLLKEQRHHRAVFSEGQFPGLCIDFNWPLYLSRSDLEFEFVRPPIIIIGDPFPKASPEVSSAAEAIVDRFSALIRLLADGKFVARGTFSKTGLVSDIDAAQWARRGMQIDVQNGDLLETEGHKAVARWTGLTLRRVSPTPAFHVQPTGHDPVPSSTISHVHDAPPPTAARSKALEAVKSRQEAWRECCAWLEEEMRKSPAHKPFSKPYWRAEAAAKWGGLLSYRAFDDAWDEAVKNSGAIPWAAAGAPKRSRQ